MPLPKQLDSTSITRQHHNSEHTEEDNIEDSSSLSVGKQSFKPSDTDIGQDEEHDYDIDNGGDVLQHIDNKISLPRITEDDQELEAQEQEHEEGNIQNAEVEVLNFILGI